MRAIRLLLAALCFSSASAQTNTDVADCTGAKPPPIICRVRNDLSKADIESRLGGKTTAWWRQSDRFTVVMKAPAKTAELCCAIRAPMSRLPGTDLWALTLRSPLLDKAIIDVTPFRDGVGMPLFIGQMPQWRGPQAPAEPKSVLFVSGRIDRFDIDGPNLGEKRTVEVYLPPGHSAKNRYRVVYMADGQAVEAYARILEPLIAAKKLPPIILAGPYFGVGGPYGPQKLDRRNAEYLIGAVPGDTYFKKHEAFFIKEVVPRVERKYGASGRPGDRLLLGISSGASWSVETALRNPARFPRAAVLSMCWRDVNNHRHWGPRQPKLFFGAGSFEKGCLHATSSAAAAAAAVKEDVTFVTLVSGHSELMWHVLFAEALGWAFAAPAH